MLSRYVEGEYFDWAAGYIRMGGSMDHNLTTHTFFSKLTFRDVVWLFPAVFVLHVCEEWPRFTNWAKRHASDLFTQRDYDTIHIAGIIVAIVFAAIVWRFPN